MAHAFVSLRCTALAQTIMTVLSPYLDNNGGYSSTTNDEYYSAGDKTIISECSLKGGHTISKYLRASAAEETQLTSRTGECKKA